MSPSQVLEVLGGRSVFKGRRDKISTSMDLVDLGERGLTKASLLQLASFLELSTGRLARLLPVTERTIQRYSRGQRFNRATSEHMLEIAQVAVRGVEVFGDKPRFLRWIERPSVAFGNRIPLDLLASQLGIDLVMDELGRIEHGVLS